MTINKEKYSEVNDNIKLPKLEITKFDGKLENWLQFWSQYETAIHTNNSLSKINKFSYLKMFLTGSALKSVQNLIVTETNYDLAIKILTENYGRNDLVIGSHMNKLLKLTPVKKFPTLYELRSFYEECITHVRSLEALGVELKSYANLLFPIVAQSIPEEIMLNFNRSRKTEKDQWDVKQLLDFFQTEIQNKERVNLFRKRLEDTPSTEKYPRFTPNNKEFQNFPNRNYERNKPIFPSAATLNTSSRKECIFCCSDDHDSERCQMSVLERKRKLMNQGRCFNCFKKQHMYRDCRMKNACTICYRKHNTLICDSLNSKSKEDSGKETIVSSVSNKFDKNEKKTDILLQTAVASLVNKRKRVRVRILLDSGSQRSFIDEELSKSLKLKVVGEEYLNIYSFGSETPEGALRKIVRVTLKNCYDPNKFITFDAVESPRICEATVYRPGENLRKKCKEIHLPIADNLTFDKPISILIGSDHYWEICSGKIRRFSEAVVGMETKFGYVFNGSEASNNVVKRENDVRIMKAVVKSANRDDEDILKKMWELESLGIASDCKENSGEEQNLILKEFEESIKFVESRYQVKFPWNENKNCLSNNYSVAERRLQPLRNRFNRSPEFFDQYRNVIDDYLALGVAEEVHETETSNETQYYMPHQAVIRNDRVTTKLRVVFDASSHASNALSLNDCIESGPNLNPDLLGILIKFRYNKIALTADIERAFLQISLSPEDRDAVRFLWVNELSANGGPTNLKYLRMKRVIFGAKSSPFLLAGTIKYHINQLKDEYPKAFMALDTCLYVDDLITGTDDENDALEVYQQVKSVLKRANFNMRKWQTNDLAMRKDLDSLENQTQNDSVDYNKILGYKWNSNDDILQIEMTGLLSKTHLKDQDITKRDVIRLAGRFYDPIGFLSPFAVRIRMLMQEAWKTGLDWDSPLPNELQKIWKSWCKELHSIDKFEIARHYFNSNVKNELENIELHCFTDASQMAYGTVVYLRFENKNKIGTSFVTSKARVSPIKKLTLPRLELMAAVIGSRIATFVQEHLGLQIKLYYWTDSSIVLHWIRSNPNKWKPFVKNRVIEIQKKTNPRSWSHCPSSENPADLLTRGERVQSLIQNSLWWKGPVWLSECDNVWPTADRLDLKEEDSELRRNWVEALHVNYTGVSSDNPSPCDKAEIFDLKKYSNFNRVLRITAWIQRFICNLKDIQNKQNGPLKAEELNRAEVIWIKAAQERYFQDEMKILSEGKTLPGSSKLSQFTPFLDEENVIRIGGRLQMANLNPENRHPIILPHEHEFTSLLIKNNHEKLGHAGVAETLTQIREKFWISKARQRIKSIIHHCNVCRKFSAKPVTQDTAPLPADRCREAHPFEKTGIDFAGPLYVKEGKEVKKAYILLFTCAVTRAIHLELTKDLTTETFLLAFKKFISRRGLCRVIYSDNAKTFKCAKKELEPLQSCLNNEKTQDYLSKNRIKWKFIAERAAWWGGFWERLVRSVKTSLKKVLGKSSLTFSEMETTVIETEAILNSRPLTYVYTQPGEPEPLTPAHFLIGRRLCSVPQGKCSKVQSRKALLKRLNHQQNLTEQLWRRWRYEYLLELQSTSNRNGHGKHLREGHVVLIHEEKLPRLMWKMGIISAVHPGRDGKIRACTVRLPHGELRRPVQLLYPLELEPEISIVPDLRTIEDHCPSGGEDVGTLNSQE